MIEGMEQRNHDSGVVWRLRWGDIPLFPSDRQLVKGLGCRRERAEATNFKFRY